MFTEELQLAGTVRGAELFEEQPPEQPREHAHGQEEPRPAGDPLLPVEREPPAGDDPVHMGVMGHRRTPGVQDQGRTDTGTQMPGVSRKGDKVSAAALNRMP